MDKIEIIFRYCKKIFIGGQKTKVCFDCRKERVRQNAYFYKFGKKTPCGKVCLTSLLGFGNILIHK